MPKIYYTPNGIPDSPIYSIINSICAKMGFDLLDQTEDKAILIENASFIIADITIGGNWEHLQVIHDIGYAKRAQKVIFLIAKENTENIPSLGQTDVFKYNLDDMDNLQISLTKLFIKLCHVEKIRYNRFLGMPTLDSDVSLPIIPKQDLRRENYVALGDSFVHSGMYEEAYQEYSRSILNIGLSKPEPHHSYIFFKRAFVSKKIKSYQDALDDYSKAIELNPSYVDAYIARGLTLYDLKEYAKALIDFKEAARLKPDFTRIYVYAGAMSRLLKQFDEAISHLNQAIEFNPDYSEAFFTRGLVYVDIEDQEKAINDFSQAIALNSSYYEAFVQRGLVYMKQKQFDLAIEDFNSATSLSPNSVEAYEYRGQALYEKGYHEYHELAIQDWKKAIELGSPDPQRLEAKIRITMEKAEH